MPLLMLFICNFLCIFLNCITFQQSCVDWSEKTQKDLVFIKQVLIENHPGFHNSDDPDFKKNLQINYNKAFATISCISTFQDYVQTIKSYVQSFDDVHLFVRFNDRDQREKTSKKTILEFASQESVPNMLWITLPTFEPNEKQQQKLEKIIKNLPRWQKKDIVIFDVRGNGGGNSLWAEKLVEALFSKEYATRKIKEQNQNTFVDWRCSEGNINHIKSYVEKFKDQFGSESEAYQWAYKTYKALYACQQTGQIYFSERQDVVPFIKKAVSNPVKAQIIVIIDRFCVSACLDFIDYLKAMDHQIVLIGERTKGDSIYMEIREVGLPSGYGQLSFPIKVYRNRVRENRESYYPDVSYDGDLHDTTTLQSWLIDYLKNK